MTRILLGLSLLLFLNLPAERAHTARFDRNKELRQGVPTTAPGGNPKASRKWRPATIEGLIVGRSKRADSLKAFGRPRWSGPPGDQTPSEKNRELWDEYDDVGEFPGKLVVVSDQRTGVILAIDLHPTSLSKAAAIEHFGRDYIVTRYAHDDCLGNGESAPVYESSNGPLISVEYRHRGIAIGISESDSVNVISYVRGPIGAKTSRCKRDRTPADTKSAREMSHQTAPGGFPSNSAGRGQPNMTLRFTIHNENMITL